MIDRRTLLAGMAATGLPQMPALAATTRPRREVLTFYYGWYANPAHSGRWFHWQGPNNTAAPNQSPTFDIPQLGQYDSHDEEILQTHARWLKQAGITAIVSSWWGEGSFEDRSLELLLEVMHVNGIRVGIYLESQKRGIVGAQADMRYLVTRYGKHPGLLTIGNRPVFFLFLQAMRELPPQSWRLAARGLAASGFPEPFLIGDSSPRETADFKAWLPALDGVHVYVMAPYVTGMNPAQMTRWATATYPTWKSMIGNKLWCATVIPGFNDTLVPGRPQPRPTVPRFGGGTFDALWRAAIAANPEWVIVTSFNEWHEGSEIEPSRQYGSAYIAANRTFARRFLTAPVQAG